MNQDSEGFGSLRSIFSISCVNNWDLGIGKSS